MTATPLPVGTRVRHYAHQFPRAFRDGTATVVGHFFTNGYLEYVVQSDAATAILSGRRNWSASATIPIGKVAA